MNENEIARNVVDAAIEVHRTLGGPGLLERVYEEALLWELLQRSLPVARQASLSIHYKEHLLSAPLRVDLIVCKKVIVECKAVVDFHSIFEAQLLTYLRISGRKLGLLINFGERLVKDGIKRVVNGL